jgi:hypothetical protein
MQPYDRYIAIIDVLEVSRDLRIEPVSLGFSN